VLTDAFGSSPESWPVSALVLAATEELRSAGADVAGVELPGLQDWIGQTAFYATQSKEDITTFLAARPTAPVRSFDEIYASRVFHPLTDLIRTAAGGPDVAAHAPDYHRMRVRQEEFRRALLHAMAAADVDVLVFPTVQIPPPTRQDLVDLRWTAETFPTNTVIASQSGLPAMTVPVGMTDDGLPVGMDVVGRPLAETQLLRFALAWEEHARPRRPPVLPGVAPEPRAAAPAL
jgi:Asp-tRNA(Asn)/Glu-tRNA(Gln) amidotransferase A subunit family amidase